MADGDYERGRGREIGAIAAELKRLAAARDGRAAARPEVFVLNGWAASPQAWDLCKFMRTRLFSYVEQLDGEPEKAMEGAERVVLVGWSMGGSSALRLAVRWPEKVAGLVLIAATPRMMEEKETGWRGMSPRRLEALRYGLIMTKGVGIFGVPEGKPNPYLVDEPANLERGLKYLLETDLRAALAQLRATNHEPRTANHESRTANHEPRTANHEPRTANHEPRTANHEPRTTFPVHIFQSEHDGIVRAANADYLKKIFPQATVHIVPGTEHALPIFIPEQIDEAVDTCLRLATAGQDIA